MKSVSKDDRRRILYVGPPGCNAIGHARQLATECRHWVGREGEQSYVHRVSGMKPPEHPALGQPELVHARLLLERWRKAVRDRHPYLASDTDEFLDLDRERPERNAVPMASFRAPHHTVSVMAMEGKLIGHQWRPGELHLAHAGVLYLDLVSEFRQDVLAAVRRAWDLRCVLQASRTGEDPQGHAAHESNRLYGPTYFSLVMYTTPCPCGWRGVEARDGKTPTCFCTERQVESWFDRTRVLTDEAERIDLPARPRSTSV